MQVPLSSAVNSQDRGEKRVPSGGGGDRNS